MFENLVNQKCRETNIRNILLSRRFENLVNQECRETAKTASIIALSFESLVNQEYRTLNIYICNQIHGEHPQPTKTKRAIGQKVLMTNPNKPDSYLNDVARSIQMHLPT